jgi:transcriptional regulator with XRE-family HTH domain
MKTEYSVSTFGHIYQKALQSQLEKMGKMLNILRRARREDLTTVAAEINIRPEILERIEKGEHDFRIETLFALCDYYNADLESIVGKGDIVQFNYK